MARPQLLTLTLVAAALWLAAPTSRADDLGDVQQLLKSGNSTEALRRADQYLAAHPKDAPMRFAKGVALAEQNRAPDAVTTFVKLTEDFPELPEPYNNLAVLYANQGQYDKARTALEMAIRTNPSYATAYENLGDVYAKLASQAYAKALQVDAGNTTAVAPKLALIKDLFNPAMPALRVAAPAAPGSSSTKTAQAPRAAASTLPAPKMAASALSAQPAASGAPPVKVAAAAAMLPTPPPAPAAASAPPTRAPDPASTAAAASAPEAASASADVAAAVQSWAQAWSRKDLDGYFGAYTGAFAGGMSRSAWQEERRAKIMGKTNIKVNVSDLAVSVNGDRATARFRQGYFADNLSVNSRKTLSLVKSDGKWLIEKESVGS